MIFIFYNMPKPASWGSNWWTCSSPSLQTKQKVIVCQPLSLSKRKTNLLVWLLRVYVHYLVLLFKASETLWTVLMIKWCGAVLQTGHCPETGCLFLWAKLKNWKSVKHLSLWVLQDMDLLCRSYTMPWRSFASVSSAATLASSCLLGIFWSGHDKALLISANCQPKDAFPKRTLFTSVGLKWSFFFTIELLNCTNNQRDSAPQDLCAQEL